MSDQHAGSTAFRRQQSPASSGRETSSNAATVHPVLQPETFAAVNRWVPRALALGASVLLLVSLKLPLWRMHLEAPQYRDQEALNIAVHPNRMQGDLRELATLDQYIGVHVPPTLPQFKWLPALLVAGAGLGGLAALLNGSLRRRSLVAVCCVLTTGLALAAFQAKTQIRDIGHKRDAKTILAGIKDFTPPFLGTSKIAQFTVSSRFGSGAWLIGAALMLQLGAARLSSREKTRVPENLGSGCNEDRALVTSVSHQLI